MLQENQVVLITGAAGGIGSALCKKLASERFRLGLIDNNKAALNKLQSELSDAGASYLAILADVGDIGQVRAAVQSVRDSLGPISIAVACAGICGLSTIDNLRTASLEEMLRVNYLGSVFMLDAVLPGMLSQKQGQIIVMASLAAVSPLPFESGYSASKAALAAYFRSIRGALRLRGVRATIVYAGFVQTKLLQDLIDESGSVLPPGVLDPIVAADRIVASIHSSKREVWFPSPLGWVSYFSGWLPPAAYDFIILRLASYFGITV